tara:strand:+ start:789 stop:1445 length:657 start_codon:yes stop_codon:yes gene_type:complete
LHIPRCGGTSILYDLRELGVRVFVADEKSNWKTDRADVVFGHFLVKEQLKCYLNYNLVTIVRDPIDIIISNYKQYKLKTKVNYKLREDVFYNLITFEEYAFHPDTINMITSQFLSDVDFDEFDYIGFYDDLNNSYQNILDIFNINYATSENEIVWTNIESNRFDKVIDQGNQKFLKNLNSSKTVPNPDISKSVMDKLKQVNKDDYDFYNYAIKKFKME